MLLMNKNSYDWIQTIDVQKAKLLFRSEIRLIKLYVSKIVLLPWRIVFYKIASRISTGSRKTGILLITNNK